MWEEGAVNVMWLGMGREAQKSSQISPYWPTALPTKLPTDTPSCGIAWQATKNRLMPQYDEISFSLTSPILYFFVFFLFSLCQKHISSQLEGGATSVPEADNKRSDSDSKMTEESTNKQMNTE